MDLVTRNVLHGENMMKKIIPILIVVLALCGCSKNERQCSFSGRVGYVYFQNENNETEVITRFKNGISGTSSRANEDVWVDVYPNWISIVLKNRNDYTIIVPRERVLRLVVETKEGNDLNIPK